MAAGVSYWKVFRLIFVVFSLYLLGDAFYRWDGAKYYVTFFEFIPSAALVTILWSIVAVFTAMLVWLLLKALEWFCLRIGWRINVENLLIFICIIMLLGATIWSFKRIIPSYVMPFQVKRMVLVGSVLVAIFITWLFRNKSGIIYERITPLVWLFGIWAMLSVFLVAYHTFGKQTDNVVSQKISQYPVTNKSRPNIILVTFDALTARDMSVYGYYRLTTPFISEWAKEASLFTRLEAGGNWTPATVASLMTGKRAWTHGVYQPFGNRIVRGSIESLPLLLRKNGYYSIAYISNPYASVKRLGIANGFDIDYPFIVFRVRRDFFGVIDFALHHLFVGKIRLYNWFTAKDFILRRFLDNFVFRVIPQEDESKINSPPEIAFNKFLEDIDNSLPEPYFVWIHHYPPHDPYLPPEPYMGMFDSSLKMRTVKSLQNAQIEYYTKRRTIKRLQNAQIEYSRNKNKKIKVLQHESQTILNTQRARYDEFVRYCDKQFEDFIMQLTERSLKNTIIILSSDHGESFEHGYIGHGGPYLYEQFTHIPLIIKESDQTEGRVINDLVDQVDIPATILDLANIPVPSWMEGRSLAPLMRGEKLPLRPTFSMNFEENPTLGHQITKGTIAAWEGDHKLIYYLGKNKSLLFNLKQDTGELSSLFDLKPEIGQRLLALIKDNLKKANEKIMKGE